MSQTPGIDLDRLDGQAMRDLLAIARGTCSACGRVRWFDDLGVHRADFSAKFGLPTGSARMHRNYCIDSAACARAALEQLRDLLERRGGSPAECGVGA